MNSLQSSKLIYFADKRQMIRFETRVALKVGWMLVLSIFALFLIYYFDGSNYLWIPILFFSFLLIFEFIFSWKREKVLLTHLEINLEKSIVVIKGNIYNRELIHCNCDLVDFSIQIRSLLLGQILAPNFQLLLKCKEKVIIKQQGNSIWPRLKLKDMEREINALLIK